MGLGERAVTAGPGPRTPMHFMQLQTEHKQGRIQGMTECIPSTVICNCDRPADSPAHLSSSSSSNNFNVG